MPAKKGKKDKVVLIDDIEQLVNIGDDVEKVVILKPAVSKYAYKARQQRCCPIDIKKLKMAYIACATADYGSKKNLDTITLSLKDAKALLVNT